MLRKLLLFAIAVTLFKLSYGFVCNYTRPDFDDPLTIEIAKYELAQCRLKIAIEQNEQLLATLKLMHSKPNETGYFMSLIYSILIYFLTKSSCHVIWYYLLMYNRRIALLMVEGRRCQRRFNANVRTFDTVDEFRRSLNPPFMVVVMRCCRPRGPPDDVGIEQA